MKRKNLPTILLVVVAFGLMALMGFQFYLLNEIDYLWGELDETYELLLGVLEQLKTVRYGIQI
jgi:hypothetical protein